ncbi:MAG TPA: Fe-S cluster assembly protein SufD [Gemmatimonadales bacterium]|nr:Fe-S cluster assembly protein SufD [Gemmatimonadales bacterium]
MTQSGDVKDRYLADFKAFVGNGAAGAPAWLKEIREGAIARFARLGFPTMKQEEWRFTNVAPIAETRFALPQPGGSTRTATPPPPAPTSRDISRFLPRGAIRRQVVFVNGRYAAALSSVDGLPGGVRAGSLADACKREVELARHHLGRYAGDAGNAFTALNTAFLDDGAFVDVAAGVVLQEPLHLVFVTVPLVPAPMVAHPRNLVIVGAGASAILVESHIALADGVYWTNAVTELVVGEGARAEYCRVQRDSRDAYHVATTHAHQERDSVLALHAITLGGALARHDVQVVLAGRGGELVLNGLYLLGGRQHADHHTVIDHAQPHCESHEYFNGVLDDQAHGVFNGRIIVRPGAQRTDSKQTNNNLLLSTEARADSQPQLEIYADDVKCTHGSTVGPADQNQLYYLRSRGLSLEAARSLLTYGFGTEILSRMQAVEVRSQLDYLVRAWLARGGASGGGSADRRRVA